MSSNKEEDKKDYNGFVSPGMVVLYILILLITVLAIVHASYNLGISTQICRVDKGSCVPTDVMTQIGMLLVALIFGPIYWIIYLIMSIPSIEKQ